MTEKTKVIKSVPVLCSSGRLRPISQIRATNLQSSTSIIYLKFFAAFAISSLKKERFTSAMLRIIYPIMSGMMSMIFIFELKRNAEAMAIEVNPKLTLLFFLSSVI